VRRVAAKDRDGFAEPDEVAIELGIGLHKVTELVRRYQDDFEWNSIPIGKLKLGRMSSRVVTLKAIRSKLRPEPIREPLPPPKHYEPPRAGRYRRRRCPESCRGAKIFALQLFNRLIRINL
jgi:hypothetical protein